CVWSGCQEVARLAPSWSLFSHLAPPTLAIPTLQSLENNNRCLNLIVSSEIHSSCCPMATPDLSPSGTPVSDSGNVLRHRSGPSSQLSGPIARFLACVEDAQRLRLPSAPSLRRGPTGTNRTKLKNPRKKNLTE